MHPPHSLALLALPWFVAAGAAGEFAASAGAGRGDDSHSAPVPGAFGDDWFHQIQVERIQQAIPTVTYPRVIKRVGKAPPRYLDA
jgi:hypothetical protein